MPFLAEMMEIDRIEHDERSFLRRAQRVEILRCEMGAADDRDVNQVNRTLQIRNDLLRSVEHLDPALLQDLTDATTRVLLARRFYNDAVRDTQALRRRWLPRLFRLGGRRPVPGFFEIDEVTLGSPVRADP